MRAFEYAFRQGGASLWRSRGSSAFAVLAIALAIIVLGALLLTWTEWLLTRPGLLLLLTRSWWKLGTARLLRGFGSRLGC